MDIIDVIPFVDSAETLTLLIFYIALGACAGFLAGLLGVGGGIVLVPGLFYIFRSMMWPEITMHMAVGTSLAVIVPTGFVSAYAHWKKSAVDFDLVWRIGIGVVAGAVTGSVLANHLSGESLKMIFACAIVVLAFVMTSNPARFSFYKEVPGQPWSSLAGFVIGGISSLIGVGGATLSVPYMSMCQVPIHRAIGTASALGLVIAVPASLGFIVIGLDEPGRLPHSLGFVNMNAWASIVIVSAVCAPCGAWLAHKVPVNILRKVFAAFMVIVALRMWFEVV